jgi:hypothetical protein
MEVGESRVRVFYDTEKREKEKNSRHIHDASSPAAVTIQHICNIFLVQVNM